MESIPHGNLRVALRTTTKTTTSKTKMTTNDCSGIMGKPSCSAVQLGRKDKPLTGVAGAFVEHQHLFFTCTAFMQLKKQETQETGIESNLRPSHKTILETER